MQTKRIIFISVLFLSTCVLKSQVENIPLENDVYKFLKEMKVKGILEDISEDNPNLSKARVQELIKIVEKNSDKLSYVESQLLYKHREEFFYEELTPSRKWEMFGDEKTSGSFGSFFSNRNKFLYTYQKGDNNFYLELIDRVQQGFELHPDNRSATLYGGGLRFHGTLFGKLGYHFSFLKGLAGGSRNFAEVIAPWLNTNFKWYENIEKIGNYDFVEGYLKYAVNPTDGMDISLQLGREPISFGYGYGDKLVLSKIRNNMDFLKFNFSWGIIDFTSLHASTVGKFSTERMENYTKYYALNRLKFKFENLFDIGVGESIVYSDRGFDFAYLNPLNFYKMVEMDLQDRDNGTFHFDIQTKCFDNLELQATYFMDENVIWRLSELDKYVNKTAYQIGAFWYEAFFVKNLSLIAEYTRTRPYIYTHTNPKNTYTTSMNPLGHSIGPNADEIYAKLAYNFSADLRLEVEYRRIRAGNNVVSPNGNIIKNVGSDPFLPWRVGIDDETAVFLDGVRTDRDLIKANVHWEPVRDITFDVNYYHNFQKNITIDTKSELSYLELLFSFDI